MSWRRAISSCSWALAALITGALTMLRPCPSALHILDVIVRDETLDLKLVSHPALVREWDFRSLCCMEVLRNFCACSLNNYEPFVALCVPLSSHLVYQLCTYQKLLFLSNCRCCLSAIEFWDLSPHCGEVIRNFRKELDVLEEIYTDKCSWLDD